MKKKIIEPIKHIEIPQQVEPYDPDNLILFQSKPNITPQLSETWYKVNRIDFDSLTLEILTIDENGNKTTTITEPTFLEVIIQIWKANVIKDLYK